VMKVFIITENLRKDINKMNTSANCYHQKKLHNNKKQEHCKSCGGFTKWEGITKAVHTDANIKPIVSVQDELLNIFNQIRTLIDDQQKEIVKLQTTISEVKQGMKAC